MVDDVAGHGHRQPRRIAGRQVDDGAPANRIRCTSTSKILCDIMRELRRDLELGRLGCAPARLHDASDEAQFAELDVLGELTARVVGTKGTSR